MSDEINSHGQAVVEGMIELVLLADGMPPWCAPCKSSLMSLVHMAGGEAGLLFTNTPNI